MFRFAYSAEFLEWALRPPGYKQEWHIAVRNRTQLVGFISGVPLVTHMCGQVRTTAEINFLCVHKKLRHKRLAPVLIKEMTRRAQLQGVWQAIYTGGVALPRPVGTSTYHHRLLNPKKLLEVGFSALRPPMTLNRQIKLLRLQPTTRIQGLRPLELKDVPAASRLLAAYLAKFQLHPVFTEEEVAHWFLPRKGLVSAYVVEDTLHQITDLGSFFILSSTVLQNHKHEELHAAYSFYNVATTVGLENLMYDMLVLAKLQNADMFNALDVMDNATFFRPLKFDEGNGILHYYLHNWACPTLRASELVLV
jgi:glycylpeptide N-tetradecanoyltransferase